MQLQVRKSYHGQVWMETQSFQTLPALTWVDIHGVQCQIFIKVPSRYKGDFHEGQGSKETHERPQDDRADRPQSQGPRRIPT